MLDDLTPEEIVALVQTLKIAEQVEGIALVSGPDGVMTKVDSLPGFKTLMEKINQTGDRADVKKYLVEKYGDDPDAS